MSDIKKITEFLINFRNDRDWEQFHNTKDLAIAIGIETGELNELFPASPINGCPLSVYGPIISVDV